MNIQISIKTLFFLLFFFFINIFFLFSNNTQAQSVGKWRAGSANTLTGKVYNLCIFVSEKGGESWTKSQKMKILKQVKESQSWLIRQAKKFGTTLSFQSGNFGLEKDILLSKIARGTGSGNESVDWGEKVFKKIGYTSSYAFYEWVLRNTTCKNTHYIIFAKGEGRGYAMPASTEMSKELYFMEGAVLYEKYDEVRPLNTSAISHEILHTYGAWDLYTNYAQTKDREEKAKKIYPNSVMLRTSYVHDELEVDELTAWLVGWNKTPKKSFDWFRPSDMPVK